MTSTRWFTKEDVLKDLDGLAGLGAAGFDDGYIVQGQKPPPPRREFYEEDDEYQLRFGRYGATEPFDDQVQPDLAGITEMLRMVDNFDTPESHNDNFKKNKRESPTNTIAIYKLNPNVQEFVPRSSQNGQNVEKNDSDNSTNDTKKMDDEKTKQAAVLKDKIIAASKANTQQHKRERNVAIAALLKLNSIPVTSESSLPPQQACTRSVSPKLTLYTPEYFEAPRGSTTILNIDENEHTIPATAEKTETKAYIETPLELEVDRVDASIQQSINKVNEWLDIPEEKKAVKPAVPYTGPVVFKKKDTSVQSQSSEETVPMERSLPTSYVPSQYASELLKKYEERSEKMNEKRENAPQDIWNKLENDLKARDVEIRKKRGEVTIPRISQRQRINNMYEPLYEQ